MIATHDRFDFGSPRILYGGPIIQERGMHSFEVYPKIDKDFFERNFRPNKSISPNGIEVDPYLYAWVLLSASTSI